MNNSPESNENTSRGTLRHGNRLKRNLLITDQSNLRFLAHPGGWRYQVTTLTPEDARSTLESLISRGTIDNLQPLFETLRELKIHYDQYLPPEPTLRFSLP